MNRRLVGLVAAVLVAAAGTFILVTYVQGAESRALEGQETIEVLVVQRLIAKGTPAAALGDAVATELVPAKVQAAGSVVDVAELEGLVASVDLLPGEQLVTARFQTPEVFEVAQDQKVEVPAGLLQVTVELDAERALGGRLRPGETVAVVASFDPFRLGAVEPGEINPSFLEIQSGDEDGDATQDAQSPNSTHLILRQILVTAVQEEVRAGGASLEPADEEGPDPAPEGKILVTLAIDPESVERVVFTAEHGFLWLAKDPEGADLSSTIIQTRGTIYQ